MKKNQNYEKFLGITQEKLWARIKMQYPNWREYSKKAYDKYVEGEKSKAVYPGLEHFHSLCEKETRIIEDFNKFLNDEFFEWMDGNELYEFWDEHPDKELFKAELLEEIRIEKENIFKDMESWTAPTISYKSFEEWEASKPYRFVKEPNWRYLKRNSLIREFPRFSEDFPQIEIFVKDLLSEEEMDAMSIPQKC